MAPYTGLPVRATLAQAYAQRVAANSLRDDRGQRHVVAALDRLIDWLAHRQVANKSSALGWLLGQKAKPEQIKGLYIHGGVGTGKTMLMDLFFTAAPLKRKRRVHFIDFMADAQDRIQTHRQARVAGTVKEDDPIAPVAAQLAQEAELLCFDEFAVNDIADAMILSRLFSALFAHGVVLVATSNVGPDDLYRDGLNRALFLPFVDLLKRHVEITVLDGGVDYRRLKLSTIPVYLSPLGEDADRFMDEAWALTTQGRAVRAETIQIKGRGIAVPRAAGRAARFTFSDLCEKPLGARDYVAIADRFDSIFIDRIPILEGSLRNEAKRLILLVDTLYDRKLRLHVSAAAAPSDLYRGASGTEAFEFARAASRLTEMQSADWIEQTIRRAPVETGRTAPA